MMTRKYAAAFAIVLMAFTCTAILTADDSDASMAGLDGNITYSDFAERSAGTIHVTVINYDTVAHDVTVTAVNPDNETEVYATQTIIIEANDDQNATGTAALTFNLSAGTHTVEIICTPTEYFADGYNTAIVTIDVPASIWSGWTPYIVLIAIGVIIIIAVYYVMRNRVKEKPDVTFTQLAEEKKKGKELPNAEKKSTTQRRRYNSETGKQTAAPAAEKKPASFTEMHEQKLETGKEHETSPAAKTEEMPKKLKYVSSRRK
ncbi:MAG: hypothetical protein WC132_00355 [Methanomethylophilus sp.]